MTFPFYLYLILTLYLCVASVSLISKGNMSCTLISKVFLLVKEGG